MVIKSGCQNPPLARCVWLVFAASCIGAGALGAVLPLLPTTPFLLLAAWAAPKASPRLDRWLRVHAYFGPALRAWREEGAIPIPAKIIAALALTLSWGVLFWLQTTPLVLWLSGVFFIGVLGFLLSRPRPEKIANA